MLSRYILLMSLSTGLVTGLILGILTNLSISTENTNPSDYSTRRVLYNPKYTESEQYSNEEDENSENDSQLLMQDDYALHNDDDRIAQKLKESVRVLCWIMTSSSTLQKKALHVRNTWGRHCNILLFMSDTPDPEFPAIGLGTDLGREHLTAKTMKAFDYVYKNYLNDADWFLKADDDTYVVVENLRYMLNAHAPSEPIYFGHRFHVIVKQGYNSGGAGYVMSKEALRRFGKRTSHLCASDRGAEDVNIGRCLERLRVHAGDSLDRLNRSRFHCFPPSLHLSGRYPSWFFKYDAYGGQKGIDSISDYPISFHYVSTDLMYEMEYMFYHLSTYGIIRPTVTK